MVQFPCGFSSSVLGPCLSNNLSTYKQDKKIYRDWNKMTHNGTCIKGHESQISNREDKIIQKHKTKREQQRPKSIGVRYSLPRLFSFSKYLNLFTIPLLWTFWFSMISVSFSPFYFSFLVFPSTLKWHANEYSFFYIGISTMHFVVYLLWDSKKTLSSLETILKVILNVSLSHELH